MTRELPASTPRMTRDGADRAVSEFVLFSSDHRRIAWSFAILCGLALVVGLSLALGLSLRPLGDGARQSEDELRTLYTLHGIVMVFLVALPVVPGVFGNALLPRLLGVDAMAWPRLNLLSLHLFLVGVVVFVGAALASPPDTGWTLDAPFSITHGSGVWWSAIGITFLCASTACASANVVATFWSGSARAAAAPKSLFAWSLVVAAIAQAFAAVVLAGVLFLLVAERAGASSLWAGNVAAGASYAAWFWLALHVALGAGLVLALGLVFEVVGGSRDERGSADRLSVACLVAVVVSSLFGFGVHLPGRDASAAGALAASALALFSGVPFALLVARFWSAVAAGRARLATATCWAIAFMAFTVTGAVAATALAVLPTSVYLEHTTYPVGVFHLLFAGGVMSAVFAGVHHLWREWFGVEPNAGFGRFACFLYFVGAELAFLPQLVNGALGVARRGAGGSVDATATSTWSAIGSLVLVAAAILVGWNLLRSVSAEDAQARD